MAVSFPIGYVSALNSAICVWHNEMASHGWRGALAGVVAEFISIEYKCISAFWNLCMLTASRVCLKVAASRAGRLPVRGAETSLD